MVEGAKIRDLHRHFYEVKDLIWSGFAICIHMFIWPFYLSGIKQVHFILVQMSTFNSHLGKFYSFGLSWALIFKHICESQNWRSFLLYKYGDHTHNTDLKDQMFLFRTQLKVLVTKTQFLIKRWHGKEWVHMIRQNKHNSTDLANSSKAGQSN